MSKNQIAISFNPELDIDSPDKGASVFVDWSMICRYLIDMLEYQTHKECDKAKYTHHDHILKKFLINNYCDFLTPHNWYILNYIPYLVTIAANWTTNIMNSPILQFVNKYGANWGVGNSFVFLTIGTMFTTKMGDVRLKDNCVDVFNRIHPTKYTKPLTELTSNDAIKDFLLNGEFKGSDLISDLSKIKLDESELQAWDNMVNGKKVSITRLFPISNMLLFHADQLKNESDTESIYSLERKNSYSYSSSRPNNSDLLIYENKFKKIQTNLDNLENQIKEISLEMKRTQALFARSQESSRKEMDKIFHELEGNIYTLSGNISKRIELPENPAQILDDLTLWLTENNIITKNLKSVLDLNHHHQQVEALKSFREKYYMPTTSSPDPNSHSITPQQNENESQLSNDLPQDPFSENNENSEIPNNPFAEEEDETNTPINPFEESINSNSNQQTDSSLFHKDQTTNNPNNDIPVTNRQNNPTTPVTQENQQTESGDSIPKVPTTQANTIFDDELKEKMEKINIHKDNIIKLIKNETGDVGVLQASLLQMSIPKDYISYVETLDQIIEESTKRQAICILQYLINQKISIIEGKTILLGLKLPEKLNELWIKNNKRSTICNPETVGQMNVIDELKGQSSTK